MKQIRHLIAGFAVGVVILFASACSPAAAKCSPSNCNGCCDSTDKCQTGAASASCGAGGKACGVCTAAQTCDAATHACVAGSSGGGTGTGGGTGVVCSAANCASGCCTTANTCQLPAGQGNGSCGTNGNACAACLGGQTCTSGVCAAPVAAIGSACLNSTDCAGLGAGAKCKQTTTRADGTYAGGYCTLNCVGVGKGNCPGTGTACSEDWGLDLYGEYESICLADCAASGSQSTCRAGFRCFGTAAQPGNCWINPPPQLDAGTPPNKLGYACTSTAACSGPPHPALALCYPQMFAASDGGIQQTEYAGGYCMARCSFGATRQTACGPNGVCIDLNADPNNQFNRCQASCPTPGSGKVARPGGGTDPYSCYGFTIEGGTTHGFLYPSCDAVGNNCAFAPTSTCNTTLGYCCFSDGGCLSKYN